MAVLSPEGRVRSRTRRQAGAAPTVGGSVGRKRPVISEQRSERDVLGFHRGRGAGRGSRRGRGRLVLAGLGVLARAPATARGVGVTALTASAAALAVHEEEVLDDDLVLATRLVCVLVEPRLRGQQPALDQDRLTLREVLADHLGRLPPGIAIDEHDILALLAIRRAPAPIDRYADRCHRLTRRSLAKGKVAGDVAHEHDFVETGGHWRYSYSGF